MAEPENPKRKYVFGFHPGGVNSSVSKPPKPKENFQMEITPYKFEIINPEVMPHNVTMKNLSEKKQTLVVELESLMFKIMNPKNAAVGKSHVYWDLEPGETAEFQIGFETSDEAFEKCRMGFFFHGEGSIGVYHGDVEEFKHFCFTNHNGFLDTKKGKLKKDNGWLRKEIALEKETDEIRARREVLRNAYFKREEYKQEEHRKENKKCSIQ